MGHITILNDADFPVAFLRGAERAHHDINAGGDAVCRTLKRIVEDTLDQITREAHIQQGTIEIQKIFRDANLEASRIEKRSVLPSQELVDQLAGYLAAVGAFISSASAKGIKCRMASGASKMVQAKPATRPAGPVEVAVVSMPPRMTQSQIVRDENGNIVSTTQVEMNA